MTVRLIGPLLGAWLLGSAGARLHAQRPPVPRNAIVVDSVVGRARMHDEVTPRQLREQAVQAALAEAIQQATGRQVASLVDYVTEDRAGAVQERFNRIIRETATGTVVRHEVLGEQWREGSAGTPGATLEVLVRAWVRPAAQRSAPPFDVQLTLNGSRFLDRGVPERSDEVVMRVASSADVWLTVFLVTEDSVEVLFPNRYVPELRVRAGQGAEVPSSQLREELGLRLRTTLPAGIPARSERLTIVATRQPIPFPGVARRQGTDVATVPTIRDTFDALAKWLLTIPMNDRAVVDATYEIARVTSGPP